ncbi:MAG: S1C family serine protease [Planctomycetaceae bacterium]
MGGARARFVGGSAVFGRWCLSVGWLVVAIVPGATRQAHAIDAAVIKAEAERVAVMQRVAPSVVAIFSAGGGGGGSGVLVSADGFALTNFHVINGAGTFLKCGLNDGVLYDAVIVGIDPTGDVALIKLFGRDDFPHVAWGDSDRLAVGDWVFAMGNPFLLATDFSPTVTYGIVSGLHRYQEPAGSFLEYTDCIQTDASINPGNSGGPLFNAAGELVGINGRGSFEKRGRVNSGAGYAISINQIKHFMDSLRGGLIVDHATLGATVATRDDGAVVVVGILEQSEAYRRGLRADDEIVSFAARPIRSVNQFKNVLGIYPRGWKLPLVFRREGRRHEIAVRLRGLHRQSELTPDRPTNAPRRPRRGKGGKDGPAPEGPEGDPKPPPAPPRPAAHPAQPSEHLARFFMQRPGFANYYFNERERDRVLRGLHAWGDYTQDNGVWKLSGTLSADKEQSFEFALADKVSALTLDNGKQAFALEVTADANLEDERLETAQLLLGMHHLRTLLRQGPAGFSECYYLGSEPLDGIGPTVDVLYCERYGARSHWFFDRVTGDCVGCDTYRDDDVDPSELRFKATGEFSGRRLPAEWSVRNGENDVGRFRLSAVRFSAAPAGSSGETGGDRDKSPASPE